MRRRGYGVWAALALTLVASGCAGDDGVRVQDAAGAGPSGSATPTAAAVPSTPSPTAGSSARSSLPPGDPGTDAPPAPPAGVPKHRHQDPPRTVVPAESLLDAGTVGAVLGGSWRQQSAQPPGCLAGLEVDPVAERAATFAAPPAELTQVVATHAGAADADRVVAATARRLQGCGWEPLPDPRLGSASAAATGPGGTRRATVVAAEGVTVVLIGSGTSSTQAARWASLADLALGSSCAAAPDGCH